MATVNDKPVRYISRATKEKRTPDEIRPAPNIAAIDFGSSSVSLAYSINGNREVKTLKLHSDYERVPNTILMKKEGNHGNEQYTVVEFGLKAQEKYAKLRDEDKSKFIYFERIKIRLEMSNLLQRNTTVESLTGGKYYMVEVIAFTIKYLRDELLKSLTVTDGENEYKPTDFDWIITVPAIWKARAKRMMREAAYLAGLTSDGSSITTFTPIGDEIKRPPEINPDKLFLALEPEVAAIFAQSEVTEIRQRKPPARYMVIDIGGGTVDITVHDQSDGKVDVILRPTGKMWGGITVNQACRCLLERIFDDKGFEKYSGSHPSDATTINDIVYVEFEKEKKIFGDKPSAVSSDYLTIPLPRAVIDIYGNDKIKKLTGVEYANDRLYINYDVVEKEMFQPTINEIVPCIVEALQKLTSKVDTIYVVGGFGGCEFMYNAIQSALACYKGKHYDKIVRPHLPNLAVVKGAVMWRQDPSIIQSRRADATYGMCISEVFDATRHSRSYQYRCSEEGVDRCGAIFKVFIEKGETTEFDDVYTTFGDPVNQSDTELCVPIYSTTNGVQYVRDKNGQWIVEEVGKLVIEVPNPDNFPKHKRRIRYCVSFSGTEIRATATYQIDGTEDKEKEVKIVCDFLDDASN